MGMADPRDQRQKELDELNELFRLLGRKRRRIFSRKVSLVEWVKMTHKEKVRTLTELMEK